MLITCSSRFAVSFATALLLVAGGCATSRPSEPVSQTSADATQASAARPAHAECLVCKKNADLACVDIDVDAKTPFADYNGKRYFFCSDECRSEFMKHPSKFASVK